MPDWMSVLILGVIEGLTEFLPVSSTGHLLLAEAFLPHQSDLFNTAIQSGAVLAVLVIFAGKLTYMATHLREPATRDYLGKLAVAFGLTAVGGLLLKKFDFKLPETATPVAWATLIGGVCFLLVERWLRGRPQGAGIGWAAAVAVGLGQLLAAVFPGTSRSGATILLALALGVGRPAATEFSFVLGIPTLLAAGGLQVLGALRDPNTHEKWALLGLAAVAAAATAFAVVRWLLRYVQHHTFVVFGWYRIVVGAAMLLGLGAR